MFCIDYVKNTCDEKTAPDAQHFKDHKDWWFEAPNDGIFCVCGMKSFYHDSRQWFIQTKDIGQMKRTLFYNKYQHVRNKIVCLPFIIGLLISILLFGFYSSVVRLILQVMMHNKLLILALVYLSKDSAIKTWLKGKISSQIYYRLLTIINWHASATHF